jgi:hypothetical protein
VLRQFITTLRSAFGELFGLFEEFHLGTGAAAGCGVGV